ncbi:MAG: type I-C CRISPR-associated protein Cas5c, partial [Planctomycetota bacterium]|nr:type I-C CRISPR-associated protein Cas5c [Planctomycetota bacterium]
MKQNTICMFVSGPLACFTRPVMKVERVSYPCMTPSAARGCLEAILWKPQFRWVVHRITVLQPIQFFSVRRNEIQDKIKPNDLGKWMKSPESYTPYYFDSAGRKSPYGEHRVQRHTLALRDVAYIIQAGIELTQKANQPRKNPLDVDEPAGPDTVIKYVAMFK